MPLAGDERSLLNKRRYFVPGLSPEVSMPVDVRNPQFPKDPLFEALDLLRAALKLLDDAEAPGPLGAQVDLAICRLEAFLGNIEVQAH